MNLNYIKDDKENLKKEINNIKDDNENIKFKRRKYRN